MPRRFAKRQLAAVASFVLVLASCAQSPILDSASDSEAVPSELLHSDLPLFGKEDNVHPFSMNTEDSFGCASRIRSGDWLYKEEDDVDYRGEERWYRIGNYGVLHCFAVVAESYERDGLELRDAKPSLFADLSELSINDRLVDLWALQIGGRPGSDYLLLMSEADGDMVDRFDVLRVDCPQDRYRDRDGLDILAAGYCAINSQKEMITFAQRMARRPPIATLVLVTDDAEVSVEE